MKTFAELLTAYMDRTGIGDAELARRIPVSRQTLVRWKEGATTRPRHRDDVTRCSELLRLTDEERDELLVTAGFSPESVPPPTESPPLAKRVEEPDAPPILLALGFLRRNWRILIAGLAASLLITAIVVTGLALWLRDKTVYPTATDGESLIVLAPFVNYTSGGQGFNVVGRLRSAIDSEVREAGLTAVRTVEWPREIDGEEAAEDAAKRSDAALVIWGEYDSGRAIARFTAPQRRSTSRAQQVVDIASTPVELPTTINIGLTGEVRHVALVTLGQLYLEQNEFDRAKTVLILASDPMPSEPAAVANLRFLLGSAYLGGNHVDFDEAIRLFTQVLEVQPRAVEALNSRGLAYMNRGRAGDMDLAVADLTQAMTIRPERAATHLNLAAAYMARGSSGDIDRAFASLNEALAIKPDYAGAYVNRARVYMARREPGDLDLAFDDLEKALEITPELAPAHLNRGIAYLARGTTGDLQLAIEEFSRAIEFSSDPAVAHFNRGLVYSELGNLSSSLEDLRRAQQLGPNEPAYNRALCWQLAVAGTPEEALPYCDRAVAQDPQGLARNSRGLVNALLERPEHAIADFEAFLAWVDASTKDSCGSHYRSSRTSWIEALKAGDDLFDYSTLHELRVKPAVPGGDPC